MSAGPVTNDTYYRIKNIGGGKFLNHYAGGTTINTYSMDGSKDQIWRYRDGRVYPESNKNFCLGYNAGAVSIQTAVSSKNPTQLLRCEAYNFSNPNGFQYYISLPSYGYLSSTSTGSLVWKAKPDVYSIWAWEEIRKVTNVPGVGDEYLAEWSGLPNGSFSKNEAVKGLYRRCFGNDGNDGARNYNLYGAMYTANDSTGYKGKFHTGVDFSPGLGTAVKAPVSGRVVRSVDDFGAVTIETGSAYVLCLHMNNRIANGSLVTVGVTQIGTVGGVGAGGNKSAFSPHLHVEAHFVQINGQNTNATGPIDYFANSHVSNAALLNAYFI